MSAFSLFLALGVFVGNWIMAPFFSKSRTHLDGFFIGIIAAVIVLICCAFIPKSFR
jgi:uncharacterized membrane protein YeaQ/YmgE (transglycosylase-associated protein family)